MKNFWLGYFLAGASFALVIVGERSKIGSPLDVMRFLFPGDLEWAETEMSTVANALLTILIAILCLIAWPFFALFSGTNSARSRRGELFSFASRDSDSTQT